MLYILRGLAATSAARLDASRRVLWFAVALPLLVLYWYTLRTNPFDMSPDPVAVTPSAWGIAHTGSPLIPSHFWPPWNPWVLHVGGLSTANRTPGLMYLAVPLYYVFGSANAVDVFPASLTAAIITAAATATLALVFARFVSHRAAFAGALIAGTATTTWAVSGTALWPHGPDELFLGLAMLALSANKHARAGLAFASIMMIRPLLAPVAVVNGVWASWKQRSLRPVLGIGFTSAIGVVGYYAYVFHYWHSPAGGSLRTSTDAFNNADHGYSVSLLDFGWSFWPSYGEKLAGVLVAPGRGILVGSPFLLLLIPGLRRAWRVSPGWVRSSAVGAGVYLLVQLKGEVFTGGVHFWSYRYTLEPLVLCAPLLALAWREWTSVTSRRRAAFGALVLLSVAWQAIGAITFRGPYRDTPWSFNDLGAALTGSTATTAWALLVGGALAAGGFYLVRRTAPASHSAQVLDVAGADDAILATAVGLDDDPSELVDVDGAPLEHGAVGDRHPHRRADRRAPFAVGRREAARRRVAAAVDPLGHPGVEAGEDRDEQFGAIEAVRTLDGQRGGRRHRQLVGRGRHVEPDADDRDLARALHEDAGGLAGVGPEQ
jgi:hypothetical protein